MQEKPKLRLWHVLLAAALFIGFLVLFQRRVNESWQEMLVAGAEVERFVKESDTSRGVLHGTKRPGAAWEHYLEALELLSSDSKNTLDLIEQARLEGDEVAASELIASLVAKNQAALEALRRGARSESGAYELDWEQGMSGSFPPMVDLLGLVELVQVHANELLDRGEDLAGIDALLDAMQLGRDSMHGSVLIMELLGTWVLDGCLRDALFERLAAGELGRAALERLEDALATLDQGFATRGTALEGEVALSVRRLDRAGGDDWIGLSGPSALQMRLGSWRYGFSNRLMLAENALDRIEAAEALRLQSELGWTARRAAMDEVYAAFEDSRNPMNWLLPLQSFQQASIERLEVLAALRLARCAVAYRLHGEAPPLASPFGGELSIHVEDGLVRIESSGPDGDLDVRYRLELRD